MKRVVLHIDRLVLKGFDRADRTAVATGLREELGRLLADHHLVQQLTASGDQAQIKLDAVRFAPEAAPAKIGSRVAAGIVRRSRP